MHKLSLLIVITLVACGNGSADEPVGADDPSALGSGRTYGFIPGRKVLAYNNSGTTRRNCNDREHKNLPCGGSVVVTTSGDGITQVAVEVSGSVPLALGFDGRRRPFQLRQDIDLEEGGHGRLDVTLRDWNDPPAIVRGHSSYRVSAIEGAITVDYRSEPSPTQGCGYRAESCRFSVLSE